MQSLCTVVVTVRQRSLREGMAKCGIYWRVFVCHQLLNWKTIMLALSKQLIQHISLCSCWCATQLLPFPLLVRWVKLVCNFTGSKIMKCGRRIVRVMPSGEVESIERCHPLTSISLVPDILSHPLTRPLSQITDMTFQLLNAPMPLSAWATWQT